MAQWQTLSDRINTVAPSATLAVDSKAKAMKAAGLDVVGFGAGEPNFPTPANVVKAAADACLDPKNYKYTPTPGLPELREAIAAKMLRDSGYEVNADQVVVTNGGKQAVYESFQILLNEGDEVIIPTPSFVCYGPLTEMAADIVRACRPGGCLVLSGLLEIQADGVTAAYKAQGLPEPRRIIDGEWAALVWDSVK